MNAGFIKFLRSDVAEELMRYPTSFTLLAQIAFRARREVPKINPFHMQVGEALIGDFQSIGLTRQQYRDALDNLKTWGYVTTRATNKGTIAMLCGSDVYDINTVSQEPASQPTKEPSGQPTDQPRKNQQGNQPGNHERTTKKNVRKKEGKEERNGAAPSPLANRFPTEFALLDEEHQADWLKFCKWENDNPLPSVYAMPKPLLPAQLFKLMETYQWPDVKRTLLAMENWTRLSSKKSAYLTALNWLEKETAA